MPADWSRSEVEATVADYLAMLSAELAGVPYNKAAHRRELAKLLADWSEQAIEFKHANISAGLIGLGFPYISGYKPRSNSEPPGFSAGSVLRLRCHCSALVVGLHLVPASERVQYRCRLFKVLRLMQCVAAPSVLVPSSSDYSLSWCCVVSSGPAPNHAFTGLAATYLLSRPSVARQLAWSC